MAPHDTFLALSLPRMESSEPHDTAWCFYSILNKAPHRSYMAVFIIWFTIS